MHDEVFRELVVLDEARGPGPMKRLAVLAPRASHVDVNNQTVQQKAGSYRK